MGAAKWTDHAEDINGQPDRWKDFITLPDMSHRLGLEESTILDALTRSYSPDDPRSAINPPAARIGGRVGAQPMWRPAQVTEYRRLSRERSRAQTLARRRSALPVITASQAADRGLVTMAELVQRTGRPKSTLNKWIRQYTERAEHPFPPVVGTAQRVPPVNMGPPKPLRDLAAVQAWITAYLERAEHERGGHAAGPVRREPAA